MCTRYGRLYELRPSSCSRMAGTSASCAQLFGRTVLTVITESYLPCHRPATDSCSLSAGATTSYTRSVGSGAVHPRWPCLALVVDSLFMFLFLSWVHTLPQLQGLRWSYSVRLAVSAGEAWRCEDYSSSGPSHQFKGAACPEPRVIDDRLLGTSRTAALAGTMLTVDRRFGRLQSSVAALTLLKRW